jgi:chromosome segregation protein
VHLQAIRLRGFKSFPDEVEVRLERGVAVIVGPNGSGKSNVADGLLWATGTLSPTELRAEKPDDVLFAGNSDRLAARWCEVELRFDNAAGTWDELPFAEVSIARRLHRGGEGQYLVNGAGVRRTDLVELLADVGLASGVTVIGQGKVEEILASSPAERRAMLEEAAGVGRFKRRRHRAELKLARVAIEVDRARDVEAEVQKRLRPLALQASAAERADKLRGEVESLRRHIDAIDLADAESRTGGVEERRTAAALERRRRDEELEALLGERNRAEEELADAAGRREAATGALYRLRGAADRLALRRETAEAVRDDLNAQLAFVGDAERTGPTRSGLAEDVAETRRAAREATHARESLEDRLGMARERLAMLDRSLAEREGLLPAARALAEEGERLALALLDVDAGFERAVAAALAWRAGALVAEDHPAALALIERARSAGLGPVGVVVPPHGDELGEPPLADAEPLAARVRARPGGEPVAALLADVWVVDVRRLLEVGTGHVVTREGHRYEPARGVVFYAGETAEAVLLEQEARRQSLADEISADQQGLAVATEREEAARAEAEAAAAALAAAGPGLPAIDLAVARRALAVATSLVAALTACEAGATRLEAPLRARADAGGERTGDLAEKLRKLGAAEADLRRAAGDSASALSALDVELARLRAEADELRRRLGDEPVEHDAEEDRDALLERLARSERRLEALGQVNPLAKEEYDREKGRLAELVEQREDLERSLAELEGLRAQLTEAVDSRFNATFASVQENFAEVAATLFPGGEGRLRLSEPGADDEDAEAGVEIDLRPVGKRVTRLSLLSGGEKALGAISFLFALFLARPSPFYLLDEVEAALDDTNIGRFVELLRRYADHAQFIVVTHQKRTMEAADVLYGVTMGPDGVSQVVSRRTPREPALAAVG